MAVNKIKSYPSINMDDLNVNLKYGWAYQNNPQEFEYSKEYWDKYIAYEKNEVSTPLNNFRKSITQKYAYNIMDVGIGSGLFIKTVSARKKFGYDINRYAIQWLKAANIYHDPFKNDNSIINGWTFWDSIEHMENPSDIISVIPHQAVLIFSLPIFDKIEKVQMSKHYRPNEHLYYFTTNGFIKFLEDSDCTVIEIRTDETKIGRENILTFVARKS